MRAHPPDEPHLSLGEFPIYLLDGTSKVADGGTDFWDGTLNYPIYFDQFVDYHVTNVWTGTTASGTSIAGRELGGDTPIVGNSGLYYDYWAYKHSEPDEEGFALLFYGISELLTVPGANQTVPEPASIITWTAIGGMLLASRAVWRRRHSDRRPVWVSADTTRVRRSRQVKDGLCPPGLPSNTRYESPRPPPSRQPSPAKRESNATAAQRNSEMEPPLRRRAVRWLEQGLVIADFARRRQAEPARRSAAPAETRSRRPVACPRA